MNCEHCDNMPPGYVCLYCKRKDGTSDFTYPYFIVTVRIHAMTPVVLWRHGGKKGKPKEPAWHRTLYDSPTHIYDANIQGIRNEKACEAIVRDSFRHMVKALEDAGYTEVTVSVSAVGSKYAPLPE